MPWFGWIAIVAILVWGGLSLFSMITGRPLPGSDGSGGQELEELKKRIEALEQGAASPELERRVDRLEARQDRRDARDLEQDRWTRQARELGLDQGGDPKGPEDA